MMRYNFRPSLVDHSQLLVLVRPFFKTSEQDFAYVLHKLNLFSHARVGSTDQKVLLRFSKGQSKETLEWGKLQLHRRPLGFIGVARLSDDPAQHDKEVETIELRFQNLTAQFDSYLYDARCIIIGPQRDDEGITINNKNIFYLPVDDQDVSPDFVAFIETFVTSLYVVLESKRIDKVNESFDKMSMVYAPNEKELDIIDFDNRSIRKKIIGRNKKVNGDLCLLGGFYLEAMHHYQGAIESLRSVNDFLWMGAALEGACAVSDIIMIGNDVIRENTRGLVIDKSNVNANIDTAIEKSCVVYTHNEMIAKYSECLGCYRRYSAGPIDIEAHFKFIRFLLKRQKKLEIVQIVQTLLTLPITFNENEKIEFFSVLASIHEQIGLMRKSAFYRRSAALLHMQKQSAKNSLRQALGLFKKVCPVYQIDMVHTDDARDHTKGWPNLQLKILLEMLEISKGLGNKLDSARLTCYTLEKHESNISEEGIIELVDCLEEYSNNKEQLHNNEGETEMEIQLIKPLPIIREFNPKKLAYHLRPVKQTTKSETTNPSTPFIFSSLSKKVKVDTQVVTWVCGDVAEVSMLVDNPLPAEIKVNNMRLITEGIPFEAHPATLALPAHSGLFPFMLLGTPKEPGTLVIKGYKVVVMGIMNSVYLTTPVMVEVTPMLPALKLTSTLPKAPNAGSLNSEDPHYQTLFTSANLYQGHSCRGKIMLENIGKTEITNINFSLTNKKSQQILFNEEQVSSKLPLPPQETLHLDIEIMPTQAWEKYSDKQKVETSLVITYSSVEEGYARRLSFVTLVKVMPSILLYDFDVQLIPRHPSCCLFSFHAINMTSIAMNVESQLKLTHECGLEHSQFKAELVAKKKTNVQLCFPRVNLPPSEYVIETLEDVYHKYITQNVSLKWTLSDTSYSGVTYLHSLKITPSMLLKLKLSHLSLEVFVNNLLVVDNQEFHWKIGDFLDIKSNFKNCHELDLENMIIQVKPYQEVYRSPEDMKQLCLPSGCLYKSLKKLTPSKVTTHRCGLVFMYEGCFMVDISCTLNSRPQSIYNVAPISPNRIKTNFQDVWIKTVIVNVT